MDAAALIDTHSHLAFEAFDADRDEVIQRAREAGLVGCLAVAVDPASARRAAELAADQPGWVHPTAGLHPTEDAVGDPDSLAEITALLEAGGFAAVGETGLDDYHDRVPLPRQAEAFAAHLELAVRLDLPAVIHCRDAFDPLLEVLASFDGRGLRGVLHCFTGDASQAERLLDAGLHLGFGGITTFKPRGDLRAIATTTPLERVLIETDAPWLAPVPHRGRRNEPSYVRHVAERLAAERGMSLADYAAATTANARSLFGLEPAS